VVVLSQIEMGLNDCMKFVEAVQVELVLEKHSFEKMISFLLQFEETVNYQTCLAGSKIGQMKIWIFVKDERD